jgi:hypothetical protein
LSRARLQGAKLSHADLKGADLRRAELWHATTVDGSANFTLADLRGADFGTPLTKKQQAELAQVLTLIPSDYTRRLVEKRLQEVLEQEGPAPQFALTADSSLPVLADAPPDRLLTAHLSWLISAPMPFYNVALADYLVGTLASRDPAIAARIATRALDGLHEEQVRPIAYAIACRLLATRGLGLKQESIDELIQNLNGKQMTCPAAPSTTSKTE